MMFGPFATAEEAALCRAHELAAQANAPAAADELAATCPICFEEIDADPDPVATTYQHIYCRKCIVDWVSTREATCPLCRGPLDGASGQLTAVPLLAAASPARRRGGWTPREWRQALDQQASIEAERSARVAVTRRSDEEEAAILYHSGVPRPVDLRRQGYLPLFSQRRGGHMSRGEAHPRVARPVSPFTPGDNYAEVAAARARRRARRDAARKQKKGEGL